MKTLTIDRTKRDRTIRGGPANARVKSLVFAAALLAGTLMLSACGSNSSSSSSSQAPATLSGNWQFTMAPPADGSFLGGLQGGFLLQANGGAVTGSMAYAVSLPELLIPCNSGSATITGTINSQNVLALTATAGTQTFTLAGTLSSDGSTINGSTTNGSTFDGSTIVGTYSSTAGTASDGSPCGTAQSGLQWSAVLVPPISGILQGSFHSTGGAAGLANQDFPVSGSLTQAANTGSSAALTGTLSFASSDYPCFNTGSDTVSVSGQISGNSVTLQIAGSGGSVLGAIGETVGPNGVTGVDAVTFDSAQGGYILHGVGPTYLVATIACAGSVDSTATAGDFGNVCLAVGSNLLGTPTGCQEPITLTPSNLIFPAQAAGTTSSQTITLANTAGTNLSGVTLIFANSPATAGTFSETDTCGAEGLPSDGQPFYFASGAACAITISFTPQCSTQCASPLAATLTLTSPVSADSDTVFVVPITGAATSEDAASSRAVEEHHADID